MTAITGMSFKVLDVNGVEIGTYSTPEAAVIAAEEYAVQHQEDIDVVLETLEDMALGDTLYFNGLVYRASEEIDGIPSVWTVFQELGGTEVTAEYTTEDLATMIGNGSYIRYRRAL